MVRISFSIWECIGSDTWKICEVFTLKLTPVVSRNGMAKASVGFNDPGKFKYDKRPYTFNKEELREIYSLYCFLVWFSFDQRDCECTLVQPKLRTWASETGEREPWAGQRSRMHGGSAGTFMEKTNEATEPVKSHIKPYLEFYFSRITLYTSSGLPSLLSTEVFK